MEAVEKPRSSGPGAKSGVTDTGRSTPDIVSDMGKTSIADGVVAKIVGIAARDVPGVYAMGAGMTRTFSNLRERIPGAGPPSVTQGVAVEVGEYQAAVDLDVVVEYGVSIPDLAEGIRRSVINAIEQMCGMEATEVNIVVGDIHIPGDDTQDQGDPRVQ
jgi:uncharacterized alkaline shock family protein YloU